MLPAQPAETQPGEDGRMIMLGRRVAGPVNLDVHEAFSGTSTRCESEFIRATFISHGRLGRDREPQTAVIGCRSGDGTIDGPPVVGIASA